MTDNLLQNYDTETEEWLKEKTQYIQALYSEWLYLAYHLGGLWEALVEAVAQRNIFSYGPVEECLRKERLDVKDERCWELLKELRKIIHGLNTEMSQNHKEIEQRVKRSAGYKFDINRDINSIIKLIRDDIRQELPGVIVSVTKGARQRGCIGSLTVRVKELGPYQEDELWCYIQDIILRYNRTERCTHNYIGFSIIHDVKHAWERAVQEWGTTGSPVPEGLQYMKYAAEKLEKKKAEKRKAGELKKAGTGTSGPL